MDTKETKETPCREIITSVVMCPYIVITTNKKIYMTPKYPDYIEQTILLNGKPMRDYAKLLTRTIVDNAYVAYTEYSVVDSKFVPISITKHKFILDGGDMCLIQTIRFEI